MAQGDDDDNQTDENEVKLWEREESTLLSIQVSPNENVIISQYGSDDDRWGIHSCVWDGGLGLVQFLRKDEGVSKDALVLDLGSGTGVVGLGLSALGFKHVVITDLPDALVLMNENVSMNPHLVVVVEDLSWGCCLPISIQRRIFEACELLVVGADVVYRQNLFDPLLTTLEMLSTSCSKVRIILAMQSIRCHLEDFYYRALARGFAKTQIANVVVPQGVSDELPVVVAPSSAKGPGIIHVVELTKTST